MSSLESKDAIPDVTGLDEAQMKTLDQWDSFFEKVCACFTTLYSWLDAAAHRRGIISWEEWGKTRFDWLRHAMYPCSTAHGVSTPVMHLLTHLLAKIASHLGRDR